MPAGTHAALVPAVLPGLEAHSFSLSVLRSSFSGHSPLLEASFVLLQILSPWHRSPLLFLYFPANAIAAALELGAVAVLVVV